MIKDVCYIEGRRDTYSASDLIGRTMTVGRLVEVLSGYDENTPIMINNDDGYTFGKITIGTLFDGEVEIDDEDEEE